MKVYIWLPAILCRGWWAEGRTIAEAMERAQDVARKLIESYIEHGDPLPAGMTPS